MQMEALFFQLRQIWGWGMIRETEIPGLHYKVRNHKVLNNHGIRYWILLWIYNWLKIQEVETWNKWTILMEGSKKSVPEELVWRQVLFIMPLHKY